MGNIKAFERKKRKISTKESWYIFSIVMLAVAFLISITMYLRNPFAQNTTVNVNQIMLGESLNVVVEDSGSFSQTIGFYGSLLPNFIIPQDGFLTLKNNQQTCKARVKIFMYDDQNSILNITANLTSDWEANPDGYYYYTGEISPELIVKFLRSVEVPGIEYNLSSSQIYNFIVTIETLPTTADYETIWKIASV